MKEQLLLLLELQKIDARVFELKASINSLPTKLEPAQKDLARLEAMLQVERDRVAETEAWRAEQEQLVANDQEALKKAKAKVQLAKTSKDFAASNREVDNKRRSISEREDEVLKVIEAMETSRAEIAAHEKDVEALRSSLADEATKIQATVSELEAEAAEHSKGRGTLVSQIEPKLLKRYDKTMRRKGVAVVPVIDGTCQGCHMAVPPQLNNILAQGESIEHCPRCQRLLYRQDWFEAEVGTEAEAVKDAG